MTERDTMASYMNKDSAAQASWKTIIWSDVQFWVPLTVLLIGLIVLLWVA